MGYCMSQMEADFRIKRENFDKCLAAIKALDPDKDHGQGYGGSGRSFAWITTSEYKNAETLKEALNAWRWAVQYEEHTSSD